MKLQLFRPLTFLSINQNFGENKVCCLPDGTKVVTRTTPNCPEGDISLYTFVGLKAHNGLDLYATDWQPVYASQEGKVIELQTDRNLGLGIGIVTNKKYEWSDSFSNASGENQIKIRYWHLAAFNVKMGQIIKVGDLIGWADNTGFSSGTHLHFEIKPVQAIAQTQTTVSYSNVLQNNGMYGAIDPLPHLQNETAFEKNGFFKKIRLQLIDILNQLQGNLSK